ncbi:MAG: sulfatase-like hydrolase/transferase [Planctomycetota bacterium]
MSPGQKGQAAVRSALVHDLRDTRTWILLLASLAWGVLDGCAKEDAERQETAPPNVILIVLDTLRADHLGCYGYDRPTSPRIAAFAQRGTVYTRAFAAASCSACWRGTRGRACSCGR